MQSRVAPRGTCAAQTAVNVELASMSSVQPT